MVPSMSGKGCTNSGGHGVPEMMWMDGPGFSLCAAPLELSGPGFRGCGRGQMNRWRSSGMPDWSLSEGT